MPRAFIYEWGALFKKQKVNNYAVYVKHPKGHFLFDTGFGSDYPEQLKAMPWWSRGTNRFKQKTWAAKEIGAVSSIDSIRFIILSHMHWDHLSGINDFPKAPVWVRQKEYNFAMSEKAKVPAYIHSDYTSPAIQWKFIRFTPTPYEVFDESLDVFQDGSIILVPLEGHTPGSIGMFVNLPSGKRYFFIGDLSFSACAVHRNAEKLPIVRNKVDHSRCKVKHELKRVFQLLEKDPNILIVPSHDGNASGKIAAFPLFEN